MTPLSVLTLISLLSCAVALWWVVSHYKFLNNADKSVIKTSIKHILIGEALTLVSIAAYSVNWILFDQIPNFSIYLETFQVLGVTYSAWALGSFAVVYSNLTEN